MNPLSAIPVFAAFALALALARLLLLKLGHESRPGKFASIDGLRGYLAFSVFLHHSSIWYFYLRSGKWQAPPSNFYNNLGQASVALFFMITALLFFSKLLDGRALGIDWIGLAVGRFFRIVPLYLVSIVLILFLVLASSHWQSVESLGSLARELFGWLTFRITPLNGFPETFLVNASVTWTLSYEILFYLSLPVIGLAIGAKPALRVLAIGTCLVVMGATAWRPSPIWLTPFFGGLAAAGMIRSQGFRRVAISPAATVIALGCVAVAILAYPSPLELVPMGLLAIAFSIIAGGSTIFGMLTTRTARALGEISYSIYLLHGMILFSLFDLVIGREAASRLSAIQHWECVLAVVPILVGLSFVTFLFIERPAIRAAPRAASRLKSLFLSIGGTRKITVAIPAGGRRVAEPPEAQ